jgi:hypothetical protein
LANHDDFLDEIIDERSKRNPSFGELVDDAVRMRDRLQARAEERALDPHTAPPLEPGS